MVTPTTTSVTRRLAYRLAASGSESCWAHHIASLKVKGQKAKVKGEVLGTPRLRLDEASLARITPFAFPSPTTFTLPKPL
jgi:hypothetical protein